LKAFSTTYGSEDPEALKSLKGMLDQPVGKTAALMLRRMKHDHLKGLPDREVRSYSDMKMPPSQAEAYARVVAAASGGSRSKGDMLKTIHALRGISLHPHGADGLDPYDAVSRQKWIDSSARVSQALLILQNIKAAGEKTLVFIEDRAVQSAFAAVAAATLGLPAEPEIINGDVAGDQRQKVVDRFQSKPPGFGLLILSPKAAGIGLTITAANHVIHLSRWWNPAVEDQCNDRVYRIGQMKPVTVHIPMAVHPVFGETSFDLKLDALLERKRSLSRDMLAPPVSESDTEDLFESAVGGASERL
ncbi:MAG: helicase, superfamily, partial [Devosia sp.]|uniref:DEAD/DEAH box helicase n=1 Tax=Devosia sp. TaxID=1871048 RepID=UPI002637392F